MECCIDFIKGIFSRYEMQNIIAMVALIFAYLAYRKSVLDGYKGWIDLAKSFQSELEYAKCWIGNPYNNVKEEKWSDPRKIVYPITTDVAKALLQKGHPPKDLFSPDFFSWVVRYNGRVLAFNEMLKIQKLNFLFSEVKMRGDEKKDFDEQSKIKAKSLNNSIHNKIIGSGSDDSSLYSCYQYLSFEMNNIEDKFYKIIPWYFRYPTFIMVFFVFSYIVLDYIL